MDFQLNRRQQLVRKMVRAFADREVRTHAAEVDANHRFPVENVEKMAAYGMMGIPFPKTYGGAGGDYISYAVAIEELSRACATTGVICAAHTLCTWPIYTYGTEQQRRHYLPDLLAGRKLGAFALTEPNAGTDAARQQTKAVLDGDAWVLNGAKTFITNGGYADVFLVMAMTDKSKGNHGITSFLVEKGDPGFSIGKTDIKMGVCGSSMTDLVFHNCRIPKDRMLGELGKGFKVAMSTLDGGRIGIAAQAIGIAREAFDQTVSYLRSRKQFGRPLAKMEALQFEMAEMATQIEAAQLLIYKAADRKDKGLSHTKEASMAKLFASETAMHVTTKCVQFHGGYGYTKEFPIERMMRDAKVTEIYEGTSEVQKMVIAAAVL